jgi:hypothetical protein
LAAQYWVVVDPPTFCLGRDRQLVVALSHDAMAQSWGIAADFAALPETFSLCGGAKVRIYKRLRPTTPAVAVQTFDKIVSAIPLRPGAQPDWVALTRPSRANFWGFVSPEQRIEVCLGGGAVDPHFLYTRPNPSSGEVHGKVTFLDDHCKGARLQIVAADAQGQQSPIAEVSLTRSGSAQDFRLPFAIPAKRWLVLAMSPLDGAKSKGEGGSVVVEQVEVVARQTQRTQPQLIR